MSTCKVTFLDISLLLNSRLESIAKPQTAELCIVLFPLGMDSHCMIRLSYKEARYEI